MARYSSKLAGAIQGDHRHTSSLENRLRDRENKATVVDYQNLVLAARWVAEHTLPSLESRLPSGMAYHGLLVVLSMIWGDSASLGGSSSRRCSSFRCAPVPQSTTSTDSIPCLLGRTVFVFPTDEHQRAPTRENVMNCPTQRETEQRCTAILCRRSCWVHRSREPERHRTNLEWPGACSPPFRGTLRTWLAH